VISRATVKPVGASWSGRELIEDQFEVYEQRKLVHTILEEPKRPLDHVIAVRPGDPLPWWAALGTEED